MIDIIKKRVAKLQIEADWWGVRLYEDHSQFRLARNALVAQNKSGLDRGAMISVMIAGHLGYYGTSDLSEKGLLSAFKKASSLARQAARMSLFKFDSDKVRPAHTGEYRSHRLENLDSITAPKIQEALIGMTASLKSDERVIDASAWSIINDVKISFISSSGAFWQQDFNMVSFDFNATARKGEVTQRRSTGMRSAQAGAEVFNLDHYKNDLEVMKSELSELLDAPECPTDTMSVILEPDQLYLQVHESIGHPLEIDRILGDERNYAGWSFVNENDFGSLQYGPEILNVTYDPTVKGELASFAFDDIGASAQKEYLIENGILKRGLGSLESQSRSQIAGVSCARSSSWNRAPIDRMGNINIEPGTSSMDDMIKSCERGVLMKTNQSWSIDDYRNKFQFGCEYAQLIEDGQIKHTVKNPNYRGVTIPFWNSLTHVGNEDTFKVWGSPYCGKGEPNQIIRVGHAVPTCKFDQIEVFGGAL